MTGKECTSPDKYDKILDMKQPELLEKEYLHPEILSYIQSLQDTNTALQSALIKTKSELTETQEENKDLREQLACALRRRFAPSAEKYIPGQGELFDQEEAGASVSIEEETVLETPQLSEVKAHKRKKAGRKPLSADLPRKQIIIDIDEEEKQCACGCRLSRIGEEKTERLQVTPAQFYVEETIRPKYVCRNCEGSADEDEGKPVFRVADAPKHLLPGSIATAGLLSFVFTNKFCDHLPYYRQEKAFERLGVSLSRQDMSNWQTKVHELCSPLEALMMDHLKTGKVIRMDETTVQVMGEEKRKDTDKSYMWLARGGPPDTPVIIYRYQRTRASIHVDEFIRGFSGFLQTDGYKSYKTALERHRREHPEDKIIHVGCMAHARRYFYEASLVNKQSKSPEVALSYIRKIYQGETVLREQNLREEDFLEQRQKKILPILEQFHQWLKEKAQNIPPSQKLAQAVFYTLGEWEYLIAYLQSPDLTPDNNLSENAIRPFVLGRKNWLFSGSPEGAKSSCFLYSLIETAKQNGRNPSDYLTHLFLKAPYCRSQDDWQALLPWNVSIEPYSPKGIWVS